jgi:hypothetical protein
VLLAIASFVYLISFPPTLNLSDEALFLYGAKRILNGQALYHDVFEFITPAGFYFFALVYAAAGTTLQVARAAMTAVNALSAALVYVLARKVAGGLEAVLATVVFVVAGLPVWNVVSPHWLSTCICLATAAVLLSDRWARSARLRPALAGALAGLGFATQQQRGVLLGVWLVVALALLPGLEGARRPGRALRALGWAAVGWMSVVVAILGYALWHCSVRELVDAIFVFVFGGYRRTWVGVMSWGGGMWVTKYVSALTWPWLATFVPLVLVLESGALLARIVRQRGRNEAVRAALLVLAGCMAAAVSYFPDLVHVSFIVAFALVVAAGLVSRSRSALGDGAVRWAAHAVLAVAILLALHKGWTTLHLVRSAYPVRYETAFGTVAGTEGSRDIFERVQAVVAGVPAARRTIFAYPNASFYLTLPGENPTPFSLLMAGLDSPEQFRIAFDALERRPPDYVLLGRLYVRPGDPLLRFVAARFVEQTVPSLSGLYFVYSPRASGDGRVRDAIR